MQAEYQGRILKTVMVRGWRRASVNSTPEQYFHDRTNNRAMMMRSGLYGRKAQKEQSRDGAIIEYKFNE